MALTNCGEERKKQAFGYAIDQGEKMYTGNFGELLPRIKEMRWADYQGRRWCGMTWYVRRFSFGPICSCQSIGSGIE